MDTLNNNNLYNSLNIKLKSFNYFLEIIKNEIIKNEEFSWTKTMKLLYFTCLLSTENEYSNGIGLFETFDRFIAYKNGPVEDDCYFYRYSNVGNNISQIEEEKINSNKICIDESIQSLKTCGINLNDLELLVDLSHSYLWNNAYKTESKILYVNYPDYVEVEVSRFRNNISKILNVSYQHIF